MKLENYFKNEGEKPLDRIVDDGGFVAIFRTIGCIEKNDVADQYAALSDNWSLVYDRKTGAITENGEFYEGCNLNYSFRLLPNMKKRIEIAGGKAEKENKGA